MPTATVTSKGQVTIPKEVRDDLGLEPGSKLMFVRLRDGQYRMVPRVGSVMDLAGALYDPHVPTMTLDDMEEAIVLGANEGTRCGTDLSRAQ